MKKNRRDPKTHPPPIYVVSGGYGSSGEQLARTALAQFAGVQVPVRVVPHVRSVGEIRRVVEEAASRQGTILHTLVDLELRRAMIRIAREKNAVAIDLMGRLLSRLSNVLEREPIGQPGLYRRLREDHFQRVEAIEFSMEHDDGQKLQELELAEIVLVGPSRVGKTPLNMYLAVQGWKVANLPLILEIPPPPQLFQIDRRRVVGLLVEAEQLLAHRRQRHRRLGTAPSSDYIRPRRIQEEVEYARLIFRRGGFPVVDMTDKPIEESAEEVILLVTRSAGQKG